MGTEATATKAEEDTIDKINAAAKGRSFANKYAKNTYVGKKEDDLWWEDVKIPAKPGDKTDQSNDEIYRSLVDNMGIFRWQNPQYVIFMHSYDNYVDTLIHLVASKSLDRPRQQVK